eukprot:NODE_4613_length_1141_cov_50.569745_g4093_i0.p1 GENE.NODE_4613_length_1141_cov_50.569745_g4093_i0~~NODE_4613_length_1141_cov_50.569745_g4093_i0.p1  ORF type:complete len:216 (+),score=39.62 NODE_4613_length_1141_cov_50.569745_g4093_i0:438-1085(+)
MKITVVDLLDHMFTVAKDGMGCPSKMDTTEYRFTKLVGDACSIAGSPQSFNKYDIVVMDIAANIAPGGHPACSTSGCAPIPILFREECINAYLNALKKDPPSLFMVHSWDWNNKWLNRVRQLMKTHFFHVMIVHNRGEDSYWIIGWSQDPSNIFENNTDQDWPRNELKERAKSLSRLAGFDILKVGPNLDEYRFSDYLIERLVSTDANFVQEYPS